MSHPTQTTSDPVVVTQRLRERAATALERAQRFVVDRGDSLSRLRALAVLQARPASDVVAEIAARQRSDGSWPALSASSIRAFGFGPLDSVAPSSIHGALDGLALLSDLHALDTDCVVHAVAFLEQTQLPDGSWGSWNGGEDPAGEARLHLTGMLAGILGKTPVVRQRVLDLAAGFVGDRWSASRVGGGRWPTLACFAQFFTNVADPRSDEALQWCGRELERGFRSRSFGALAVARALLYCDAVAFPGCGIRAVELVEGLIGAQAEDGSFAALSTCEGDPQVAATIDAMRALVVFCAEL